MGISKRLLDYFNREKSSSTDKNHTRYRNDICNHWDLDYMSIDEIDRRCPKPTRRVVLPGCGHDPCYERPDQVLTELTRFCADVEPDVVRPGAGS